ncbi:MAG TPA: hypothetical protein VJ742_05670, partial [Nitrososphaera sp.]|nr:hypothetical protein [Nitrososphaera sp.]
MFTLGSANKPARKANPKIWEKRKEALQAAPEASLPPAAAFNFESPQAPTTSNTDNILEQLQKLMGSEVVTDPKKAREDLEVKAAEGRADTYRTKLDQAKELRQRTESMLDRIQAAIKDLSVGFNKIDNESTLKDKIQFLEQENASLKAAKTEVARLQSELSDSRAAHQTAQEFNDLFSKFRDKVSREFYPGEESKGKVDLNRFLNDVSTQFEAVHFLKSENNVLKGRLENASKDVMNDTQEITRLRMELDEKDRQLHVANIINNERMMREQLA